MWGQLSRLEHHPYKLVVLGSSPRPHTIQPFTILRRGEAVNTSDFDSDISLVQIQPPQPLACPEVTSRLGATRIKIRSPRCFSVSGRNRQKRAWNVEGLCLGWNAIGDKETVRTRVETCRISENPIFKLFLLDNSFSRRSNTLKGVVRNAKTHTLVAVRIFRGFCRTGRILI